MVCGRGGDSPPAKPLEPLMPAETFTTADARDLFNAVIAKTSDADKVARLELAREALTNPDFFRALADKAWAERRA